MSASPVRCQKAGEDSIPSVIYKAGPVEQSCNCGEARALVQSKAWMPGNAVFGDESTETTAQTAAKTGDTKHRT